MEEKKENQFSDSKTELPQEAGAPAANANSSTALPSQQEITNVLMAIEDPEIHINIVDLGLVYKVDRDETAGKITLDMTLTSPACPFGPQMLSQTHSLLKRLPGVKDVKINTVWSPKWDPRVHASEVAQMMLGLI